MSKTIKIGIGLIKDPFEEDKVDTPYYIYCSECKICNNISRKLCEYNNELVIICDDCKNIEVLPLPPHIYQISTFVYWCKDSNFTSDNDENIDATTFYEIIKILSNYKFIDKPAWAVKIIKGECEYSLRKYCIQSKCMYNKLFLGDVKTRN